MGRRERSTKSRLLREMDWLLIALVEKACGSRRGIVYAGGSRRIRLDFDYKFNFNPAGGVLQAHSYSSFGKGVRPKDRESRHRYIYDKRSFADTVESRDSGCVDYGSAGLGYRFGIHICACRHDVYGQDELESNGNTRSGGRSVPAYTLAADGAVAAQQIPVFFQSE